MHYSASLQSSAAPQTAAARHDVRVTMGSLTRPLEVARTDEGSSVSSGELLLLALATCFRDDIYREAKRYGLRVDGVEVEASADFAGRGLAATNVRYRARIDSPESDEDVATLLRATDSVAEIQNTLRGGTDVTFEPWVA